MAESITLEPYLTATEILSFPSKSSQNQNDSDLTIMVPRMGRQLLCKAYKAYTFSSRNPMIVTIFVAIFAMVRLSWFYSSCRRQGFYTLTSQSWERLRSQYVSSGSWGRIYKHLFTI